MTPNATGLFLLIGHDALRCEGASYSSQADWAKSQTQAGKSGFTLHKNADRTLDRIP